MHLIHTPAEMVMVDFAVDKMCYVNKATCEVISWTFLVCVLPFNKYTFTMSLPDLQVVVKVI
jgi:hypothetical protein